MPATGRRGRNQVGVTNNIHIGRGYRGSSSRGSPSAGRKSSSSLSPVLNGLTGGGLSPVTFDREFGIQQQHAGRSSPGHFSSSSSSGSSEAFFGDSNSGRSNNRAGGSPSSRYRTPPRTAPHSSSRGTGVPLFERASRPSSRASNREGNNREGGWGGGSRSRGGSPTRVGQQQQQQQQGSYAQPTISSSASASHVDEFPLGLNKMDIGDLEFYVEQVRERLEEESMAKDIEKVRRKAQYRKSMGLPPSSSSPAANGVSDEVATSSGVGPAATAAGESAATDRSEEMDPRWYSRCKMSKAQPLRSLLLDPKTNNIPPHQTKSDLDALVGRRNIPHCSYDIDGDGVVSQEDYSLAKRFDCNGDGVLDEAEKLVGRRIIAEDFFDKHDDDLHLYGHGFAQKPKAHNITQVAKSRSFKKLISELREKEKMFSTTGSQGVLDCVTMKNKGLLRHNFYNDKFDTSAWNDFTRDPRDPAWLESRNHDGSRQQLAFMRKIEARELAQARLNKSYDEQPHLSTKRITLITNVAIENS